MDDAAYLYAKARQCRRLLAEQLDQHTGRGLEDLAQEYEAKAETAAARSGAASGGEAALAESPAGGAADHDGPKGQE